MSFDVCLLRSAAPSAKHFEGVSGWKLDVGNAFPKRKAGGKETVRATVLQVALFRASVGSLRYSGSACSSACLYSAWHNGTLI